MSSAEERFRVGDLILDVGEQRLRRGTDEIPLPPKVFALLVALVRRAGRLVAKEELVEELWAGLAIGDASLTQTMFLLRRALDSIDAQGVAIETVPKRGYRLRADVQPLPADDAAVASLVAAHGAAFGGSADPPETPAAESRSTLRRAAWLLLLLGASAAAVATLAVRSSPWGGLAPARAGEPRERAVRQRYRAGAQALRQGDALTARRELTAAVEQAPDSPLAIADLIAALLALGDERGAAGLARPRAETVAALPEASRVWVEAQVARALGDTDAAIAALERLLLLSPEDREAGLGLAGLLSRSGRGREALVVVGRLRQLAGSAELEARVDFEEAKAAYDLGEAQRAQAAARRAAERVAGGPASLVRCRARMLEAAAQIELGDPRAARTGFALARADAQALGAPLELARAERGEGLAATRLGELDVAERHFSSALAHFREGGERISVTATLGDLAGLQAERGRFARAVELYRQALAAGDEAGGVRTRSLLVHNLASALGELGLRQEARAGLEAALAADRAAGFAASQAWVLLDLAELDLAEGHPEEASPRLREAARLATEVGSKELLAHSERVAARRLAALRREREAADHRAVALRLFEQLESPAWRAEVSLDAALAAFEAGDDANAAREAEAAAELFARAGSGARRAVALALTARAANRRGDVAGARTLLAAAHTALGDGDSERSRLALTAATLEIERRPRPQGSLAPSAALHPKSPASRPDSRMRAESVRQ